MVKLKHWEYENEWRLIVKKNDNNLDRVYFSKDCVQEILIGYKSFPQYNHSNDENNYKYFMDILKSTYPTVNLYTVGPHEKEFSLYKRRLIINPDIEDLRISLK